MAAELTSPEGAQPGFARPPPAVERGNETAVKLRVEELTKTYGPVTALADANLEMREGEFLTLLGPSGSGKTTLLMMVAGLTQPTSGQVWIDGALATYMPAYRRDIGMVFQNYALFPHLTVRENIAFPLRMRHMPGAEIEREVRRALDIVQLPDVIDRLPRELSGGQQQRIALARCMVYRPSIILMDEPLGALDKKLRDHMQLEIKRLHTRLGITVLYVTHDQEEAMAMSDRICLMNSARIEQVGTPDELYFAPRSVFAADFLGESNILEGSVAEAGATVVIRGPAGSTLNAAARGATVRAGERVRVMVRPESLRVLGEGETAANELAGTLRDIVFVGGIIRLYVALADGTAVVAKRLTPGRLPDYGVGSPVRLGWRPEDSVLLPGDA
jgi:putative spermidine/putrescine transport system ATP-binding protein